MTILIASRRKKLETLQKQWPNATIIDVTSKGEEPWVRFSPFFPHGGIPIPKTANAFAQSVEGLWQGLKVFEKEDIDASKWAITSMRGIKRSGAKRGRVRGHRFGVGSETLLGYHEARVRIYLPAYKWILDHCLKQELAQLRHFAQTELVLLDYETNTNIEDLTSPLSHAALIRYYLEDAWPQTGHSRHAND